MNERLIRKRYWGLTVYFAVIGVAAVFIMIVLTAIGRSQSGMSAGSGSVTGKDPAVLGTVIYCSLGVVAGLISRVKIRLALAALAHIQILFSGIFPPWNYEVGSALGNGLMLCIFLAIPFGWAWIVLVKDFWKVSQTTESST